MPDTVLIASRFPKSAIAPIAEHYTLLDTAGRPASDVFDAETLSGVRALVTAGGYGLDAARMDMLPSLGLIVCYGTGYDGLDLKAAADRDILVANSPGANAAAVADLAMALLLAVVRRIVPADGFLRDGGWAASRSSPLLKPPLGLTGRRVGVYGMGEIGRKIATRAEAFETEVRYFSRSRHDVPWAYVPSLGELAEWGDVLMVAVRAGAETLHAIDADLLRRLGPEGVIVNIARGSVIDEAALSTALEGGVIAGAGLDVFETEPCAPARLMALPNVVLTPHIGGHTLQSHRAMQDCVLANLAAFFAGKPVPHPVGPGT